MDTWTFRDNACSHSTWRRSHYSAANVWHFGVGLHLINTAFKPALGKLDNNTQFTPNFVYLTSNIDLFSGELAQHPLQTRSVGRGCPPVGRWHRLRY